MERDKVTSSHIVSIGYDPATQTLEVEFSGNKVYQYPGVTQDTFNEFKSASSKGSFFHSQIRPNYAAKKL